MDDEKIRLKQARKEIQKKLDKLQRDHELSTPQMLAVVAEWLRHTMEWWTRPKARTTP